MSNTDKTPQETGGNEGLATDGGRKGVNPFPPVSGGRKSGKTVLLPLTDKQKTYLDKSITAMYRSTFVKAFEGNSREYAIRAKCLACCNLDREEITHCTVQICPLWPVRPYQEDSNV